MLFLEWFTRRGSTMKQQLRILHLEDEPDYAQLIRDMLAKEGIDVELVLATTRAEFEAALAQDEFDLILADYSLPSFTGIQALEIVRAKTPEVPFLLVSGTIGEQAAIESLRAGATDYVLKHSPERLAPAVRRAVEEAQERIRCRRAEAELVRREKYFRALTDNSLDIVTVLNHEGVFQFNSPSVKRVLGYEPAELLGKSAFALIHPEDLTTALGAFQHGLAHPDESVTVEFRFQHRDGSWVCLETVGQSRLGDPNIAAIVLNSRDVTVRNRMKHQNGALSNLGRSLSSVTAPQEAAEIIRAVADELFDWDAFTLDLLSPDYGQTIPILNVDTMNGRRVEVETPGGSHKTTDLARCVVEDGAQLVLLAQPAQTSPEGLPFGDTSRPSASMIYAPIRSRTKAIGILSLQSYASDAYSEGDLKTLQALADHCGGALDRIQAEQALRDSEQRFRDLFENSPDAIFVEDREGNVLDVNPAACRLHGASRERLLGMNVLELVPPEMRREVTRNFQRLFDGEITHVEGESSSLDGRVTPVDIRGTQLQFRGQPALLLHVRDISERKQSEAALRSSEMLFHSIWENSVDGLRLTDEQGFIVAVNEAFSKLVGMHRTDLEGKPFTVIYAESEQPERILNKYQQAFRERTIETKVERRFALHNGTVIVLENTNAFVELPGQPPMLLASFRDVTAEKVLEDQLRQSQKMEAIGQLAGGVAHDFNNILTVIHGHASLLLARNSLTATAGKSVQQIVQASERAAGLTRQLLTFSRRQIMQPRLLDFNELVGNMTKMLGRILGEDIALELSYSPERPLVRADASMMEQVLLNLAVNARDAMPRGGQLCLHISLEDLGSSRATQHADARQGRFVCLTVADSGGGIPPEILRRIFEPFFTTKEVGKGTGLGLATVYGILKQHSGWIEVESELGRGTTFRVYLPTASEQSEHYEEKRAETSVRGGSETILVVEDERPVRELVCNLLQGHGYHTLEAESGLCAMQVWHDHKDKIALLLTDVVMPDQVNGRELAEKLWAERPGLKVIFTSGYSADVVGRDWVLRRGLHYVQKPYQPRELAQAVRQCLDAADLTPYV
jgi:two-component system cell cycle sensor histidine kinase/response regulator CckA